MSAVITSGDYSRGLKSYYGGSTKDQYPQSPKQLKSRTGHEFLGLSRCAACYNHNASSMHWRGGDGESSTSAEDSESEVDCESEEESCSSSSCSEHVVAEAPEKPETERLSPVRGDAAEPECGGEDADGRKAGDTSQSQEHKTRPNDVTRRAPLVKSFSLPASFTPHLTPFSLLPRPPRIVSALHLQVLTEKHDDDTFFTIRQHLSEREHENTEQSNGRGGGRIDHLLPPQPFQWHQMGLPWQQRSEPILQQHQYQHQHHQQQQQMLHQYQQQLPQHFPPLLAQGQMLPPPLHTLPMFHPPILHTPLQAPHAPQTHLHAVTPQPNWYYYRMHSPYAYWSRYGSGQLPRCNN